MKQFKYKYLFFMGVEGVINRKNEKQQQFYFVFAWKVTYGSDVQ